MTPAQQEQFTQFLRQKALEGKADVGYPATKFHGMLNAEGGYETANKLLHAQRLSQGFTELVRLGRIDLTVEALIVESEWRRYFDPILITKAEDRLRKVSYPFTPFQDLATADPPIKDDSPVVALPERPLPLASADGLAAAEWLKASYAAVMTWESRKESHQQGDVPLRIYTLPGGAQTAIRMNKGSPAIYVSAISVAGADVTEELSAITPISERYTGVEPHQPPSSILSHAKYLQPSARNPLVRLNPAPGAYRRIYEAVFGSPETVGSSLHEAKASAVLKARPVMDEEQLRRKQERDSETGRKGELAALEWERDRLAKLTPPCPDPEQWARRISTENVAAGYDIVSAWPGEERYIEVKTTSSGAREFFMSENERSTLERLGGSAWLYRVELVGESSAVVAYQDPAAVFDRVKKPSAWRVRLPDPNHE